MKGPQSRRLKNNPELIPQISRPNSPQSSVGQGHALSRDKPAHAYFFSSGRHSLMFLLKTQHSHSGFMDPTLPSPIQPCLHQSTVISLHVNLFVWNRVSLYSSGCPRTHYVSQAGLNLPSPGITGTNVTLNIVLVLHGHSLRNPGHLTLGPT